MGELFRQDDKIAETRSIFSKIGEIWKNHIIEKDLQDMRDPVMSSIDEYYYLEAIQHLHVIKSFFETEIGPDDISTAEAYMSYGMVSLKIGQFGDCVEYL